MSAVNVLEPAAVWEIFADICSVPHPSGHEKALALHLTERAAAHGLTVRMDAAGNLRIDRPASPGFEHAPAVILQGHLDMVPQARDGVFFDFLSSPIPLAVDGDWVRSAAGTTLGGDDGMGVALALAALEDREFKTGRLAAVFTVGEEVGLLGANSLDRAFLDGDILINLDNETEIFCVGCAGGCRQEFSLKPPRVPAPETGTAVRLLLSGLPGGHSGIQIDEGRGNAVTALAELLSRAGTSVAVGSMNGGLADNAIPSAAEAVLVADDVDVLKLAAAKFADVYRREFKTTAAFSIEVTLADTRPALVWHRDFQTGLLDAMLGVPDGVIGRDKELGIVETSSNLAAILCGEGDILIRTSQRSSDEAKKNAAAAAVAARFTALGASVSRSGDYPGWKPDFNSGLLRTAARVYKELFGVEQRGVAIHAGLEAGLFAAKNPKLAMLSFGPETIDLHSPDERVSIVSVARINTFLRRLLVELAGA